MSAASDATLQRFEAAITAAACATTTYVLTLFVSGASDRSARAISNAQSLCDTHLAGRHELLIIDLHEDLEAVRRSAVLAAPTLVRHRPLPVRRFVGDLSKTDAVIRTLGLGPAIDDAEPDDG